MPYNALLEYDELLCPIPWWWMDPHPHRRLADILRDKNIPELHRDYVPQRDAPMPTPLGAIESVREHIAAARSLVAVEGEADRGYAMVRSLTTREGIRRFAEVNGMAAQPVEPGEPPRGPWWRWPIQKLIAAELFTASLETLDADFADVLRTSANEAAGLA